MTERRRSHETPGSQTPACPERSRRERSRRASFLPPLAPVGLPHLGPAGPRLPVPIPDPHQPLAEQEPAVLLAMCVFGEARGESEPAQRAVAQVALNRATHPHPVFGSRPTATLEENLRRVILQAGQFSSLHPADPNYPKLLRPLDHEDATVWERCWRCAVQTLADKEREDALTANSDHYFDDSIQPPSWADPAKRTVKLGRLNFYRLYLPRSRGPGSSPNTETNRSNLERGAAEHPPTQEPPTAEPVGAAQPSPAASPISGSPRRPVLREVEGPVLSDLSRANSREVEGPVLSVVEGMEPRVPFRRGESGDESRHPRSLPPHLPQSAWHPRLAPNPGEQRAGRLPRQKTVASDKWPVTSFQTRTPRPLVTRHGSLLLALGLLLTACSDLERTAYRALAVTQAEYETIQRHVAEAAVHGQISEEQWNRFQVEGHRFLDAHNAAVDAFELWSRTKSQGHTARLEAMLEILPRLLRDLNRLVESLESEPLPEGSGGSSSNQRPTPACLRARL